MGLIFIRFVAVKVYMCRFLIWAPATVETVHSRIIAIIHQSLFFCKRQFLRSSPRTEGEGKGLRGFTDTIKKVFNLQYVAGEPTSAKLTFRVTSVSREDFLLDSVGSFHPLLEIQCGEEGGRCCRDKQKSTVMCLDIRASFDVGGCKYLIYKKEFYSDRRSIVDSVGGRRAGGVTAKMAATRTWTLGLASHFHVSQ